MSIVAESNNTVRKKFQSKCVSKLISDLKHNL